VRYAAPRSLRGSGVKLNKFTDTRRDQEKKL
jgi:hypothetical protein